jgi:NAD(P)H-flavin reductase
LGHTGGRDVVVIAGGIGLAPLRPLVHHLLGRRRSHGALALLCGARSPDELVFRRDLQRWQNRADIQVAVTVDAAYDGWSGHVGVVTRLIGRLNVYAPEALAMVCGPEIMMRFAVWELLQRGFDPRNIYLSLERHMQCGSGVCGHCQFGPEFVCRDGPVFAYPRIAHWFLEREV